MRWENVDLKAGLVTLLDTKSADQEILVLNSATVALLSNLPRVADSPWVLPQGGNPSQPMRGDTITGVWSRIRHAAGIPDIRLHDLRHTVGTYAGQTGANSFLVRDLLRHKTLAMTGRYVNPSTDPVRELSDKVAGRIVAGLEGKPSAEVVDLQKRRKTI